MWVRALPCRPCCQAQLPATCSTAQQKVGALGEEGAGEVEMWHCLLPEISYSTAPLDILEVLGTGNEEGKTYNTSKEQMSGWGILSFMVKFV